MNKTILITGSSRGIGRAIALYFAKNNWNVIINCSHESEELKELLEELKKYDIDFFSLVGDIGNYSFAKQLYYETKNRFGKIDAIVNNAGISYIGLLTDMAINDWNKIVSTNLTSVFNTCNLFVPDFVSKKSGKIINISSMWGDVGASCEVAYSATKGGVNSFTKALAKELAPSNIQVNAISCGVIDTQMNSCFTENELTALEEDIPIGRLGKPEEVAQLVFDIANTTSYLTGQIIRLDGGYI